MTQFSIKCVTIILKYFCKACSSGHWIHFFHNFMNPTDLESLRSSRTLLWKRPCLTLWQILSSPLRSFHQALTSDSICSDTISDVHISKEPHVKGQQESQHKKEWARKGQKESWEIGRESIRKSQHRGEQVTLQYKNDKRKFFFLGESVCRRWTSLSP